MVELFGVCWFMGLVKKKKEVYFMLKDSILILAKFSGKETH